MHGVIFFKKKYILYQKCNFSSNTFVRYICIVWFSSDSLFRFRSTTLLYERKFTAYVKNYGITSWYLALWRKCSWKKTIPHTSGHIEINILWVQLAIDKLGLKWKKYCNCNCFSFLTLYEVELSLWVSINKWSFCYKSIN